MAVAGSPTRPSTACLLPLTFTLTLVAVTCVGRVKGQTPNTLSADGSTIVWGELAPDKPYKTADFSATDGTLDPYYALAVSFIDTSLPEVLPVALTKDILDGKASIGDSWQDLAKQFVGFALCVVIGLLFILIFPIVGCCFCCCRCCGNCGGKRIHKQGPNDKCKRIGFAVALAILSLFVLTGAACVFVTSDEMHKNLDGLTESFSDGVDDFETFADNLDQQFQHIGDTNFQFLKTTLDDYVTNASPKLSESIITAVNEEVNLDTALDEISQLSDQALAEVTVLEGQVATLEGQRDTAKGQLSAIACGGCLANEITYLNGMDLTPVKTDIATFKSQLQTNVFEQLKTDLDTAIKTEVDKGTQNINVVTELDTVHANHIQGLLDEVTDFKANILDETTDYQEQVDDWADLVKPYDKYRWYAGVGMASLLGVLAVMMLLGVILGTCCGSARVSPTERGGASNCGGLCLMASVGLVFIFGALLMVVCTLMYMFGSLTERYVCQSFDHLERLEEYSKTFDLGKDLSDITVDVNGEVIHVTLKQLMTDCQEGKTMYTALGLSSVVDKAFTEIDNYKATLNDLNGINFGDAANDINGNIDVDSAIQDLEDAVDSIDDVKTAVENLETAVEAQKTSAETIHPGAGAYYDPMLATLTAMIATCDSLKTTADTIRTKAQSMKTNELQDAITKLEDATFMETLIQQVTTEFTDTIFGFVDSYVNDMTDKLKTDVGKCTPFYSITNAIVGEAICHGIVDTVNGFWLALGWSLFFLMPSMILAVKLAKHYRTMLYEDRYDATTSSPPPPYYTNASGVPPKGTMFPHGPNNKVAPF